MILAFLFGIAGFAVRFFWIPALMVMAVVFGMILADRRKSNTSKSVVTEIVATIASEARDIHEAVTGPSSTEGDAGDETTEDSNVAHDASNNDGDSNQEGPRLALVAALNGESPVPTNGTGASTDASPTRNASDIGHATRETVGASGETESGETESGEIEPVPTVEGGGSTERDDTDSVRPMGEPSTSSAAIHVSRFPGRLIISADQMAAHNRLLRPARKHLFGVVTSISEALLQVSTHWSEDSDR